MTKIEYFENLRICSRCVMDETDTNALWLMDAETGEYLEMLHHDPDYDLSSPMHGMFSMNMWFSSDGYELYGFSYEGAKTEKVYFDEYFQTVDMSLEAAFPDHEVSIRDWSDDLTRFLFRVSNDKDPGSTYLFDISKGKVSAFIFVINLFDLGGSDNLISKNYNVENLIDFPGH